MTNANDWTEEPEYVPTEWVPLLEAVDEIAAGAGRSYGQAKLEILELIADGRLGLRCLRFRQEAELGQGYWNLKLSAHPRATSCADRPFRFRSRKTEHPLPLSKTFWARSEGWTFDLARIEWDEGLLIGTRPSRLKDASRATFAQLRTRRVASGVVVQLSSIPTLLHSTNKTKSTASAGGNRGPPGPRRPKFDLAPILARLESEINDGRIYRLGMPTDWGCLAKLEGEIRSQYQSLYSDFEEPSESTVRRKAKHLMDMWKSVQPGA